MAAKQPSVDLGEFYRLSRPKKKPCHLGYVRDQLPPAEAEQLEAACQTDKSIITTGAVRDWLSARGHDINVPAITSHRQGQCSCHEQS